MKKIDTLVDDIQDVLSNPTEYDNWDENIDLMVENIRDILKTKLATRVDGDKANLRMSNFATPDRKLWYSVNEPEKGESFSPQMYMNFLYGDIIEELVLLLARISGHKVEGEQDTLYVGEVKGHRDAVIDGMLVDVKSANSMSFGKFKYHNLEKDDPFGYVDQLSLYHYGSKEDERVTEEDAAFLAVDKERGHIVLDRYKPRQYDYSAEAERKSKMLASSEVPPRCHTPIPDGKSGNMKLGLECSYCNFKDHCYPNLRTFLYSGKPRFLTTVVRQPADHIAEVNKKNV